VTHVETKYLILTNNGYDDTSVHYCNSKEELTGALRSKDYFHYSFPIQEIEVYEVACELTQTELLDIRGEGQ
tara:strand:+ start:570 stop:785 length:216 start_codon:yes stop_codon:yes gene_type:complete